MIVNTKPAVINREKMLAFAYEYDNIPLHTDEEYAKKTVLSDVTEAIVKCRLM